ncbi:hypothetical protein ACFQE5_01770 [Pseudonocardia hispaniensis]|uniref:DUF4254 domain-containing protein n=1 Tax=Pseudonocardia hispaniensis TaxID=904933 RepID=A0ABW1IXP7_9PSEU
MSMFAADPAEQVLTRLAGLEASYHCPNLETVERHILANRDRIARSAGHAPRTAARLRHDIDLLLERWLYLHETSS